MRKILLGTTAVVGAALLGANGAQAQTAPTVRIGGYFEFNVGYTQDTMDTQRLTPAGVIVPGTPGSAASITTATGVTGGAVTNTALGALVAPPSAGAAASGLSTAANGQLNAPRRDRWDFRQGDTEIHIFVTGKAANGLSYGMTMELQFDNLNGTNSISAGTGIDTDEAYGFVSSPTLGTLRFGDEDSAASLMQTRVPTITGMGPDNMWDEFVARTPDGQAPYLISGINDGNDATKIIYLSPQFFGFDFGVSFAPNGREGEGNISVASGLSTAGNNQNAVLQRDRSDSIRNELSYAVRYRGSFGNVGVATSFAGMRADPARPGSTLSPQLLQDISVYHLGAALTAFGFTLGGEYNWGDYGGASVGRTAIRRGLDNSTMWTLGLTYVAGPIAVGAFYGQAERDNGTVGGVSVADRKQTVWGVGTAYTLAPGLELVANYTRIEDRNLANNFNINAATASNAVLLSSRDIDMFIFGTRIAF